MPVDRPPTQSHGAQRNVKDRRQAVTSGPPPPPPPPSGYSVHGALGNPARVLAPANPCRPHPPHQKRLPQENGGTHEERPEFGGQFEGRKLCFLASDPPPRDVLEGRGGLKGGGGGSGKYWKGGGGGDLDLDLGGGSSGSQDPWGGVRWRT